MIQTTFSTGVSCLNNLINNLVDEYSKCINCGFCEAVCPTYPASGYKASFGARGRINLANLAVGEIKSDGKISTNVENYFYTCLSCYACLQVCPAGVNAGRVSDLMKVIMAKGDITEKPQENPVARMIVNVTMKYMNPLGVRDICSKWAENIEFDESDTILYTGNMYQLMAYSKKLVETLKGREDLMLKGSKFIIQHPTLIRIFKHFYDEKTMEKMEGYLKNIVLLLKYAGVKFSYLKDEEPYPGTMMFDFGYLKEFSEYAKNVVEIFRKHKVRKIIVIDPHTYDILKNEYPKYVKDFDFQVFYYLDFLKDLKFIKIDEELTYHEPCHLTRRVNYDLPKDLLSKIGTLKMPDYNGKNTFCCGGPDEMLYPKLSEKVSLIRFRELKDTGAKKIITACPICFANLAKDNSVEDISSVLVESLKL